MAAGIGQIALGRKKAQSMFGKGTSQAPQIAYQLDTQKREDDSAFRNEILQSLAVLGTGFKQKEQGWSEFTSGAERAGIDLGEDITKPGFVEKIKRGIGISKVPLDEQYTFGDESKQMSGAELMNIGERQRLGTLESFLEGKEISDVFGSKSKGFQAYEAFGQEGVDEATASAGGRSWEDFRDKQIKGKGVGTDYGGKVSYNQETYNMMEASERGETVDVGGDFKSGDTYSSLVENTYGEPDRDRAYTESPSDKIYREATYTQEGKRRMPDDPMAGQRKQYASGVEQGVFAEGTTVEDWWSSQSKTVDPMRPRVESEEADADFEELSLSGAEEEGLANWEESMKYQQNLPPDPVDPYGKERSNLEQQQLGVPNPMSLEDVWKKQDDLNQLLKSPATTPAQPQGNGESTSMGQVVEPDTQSFGQAFKAANKMYGDVDEFMWQGKSFTSKRA